jgi:hypothetical protein
MAIINGCCGFGNSYTFVKNENQYNFDVDAENWANKNITDQASFNAALGVTTDAFQLNGTNIKANITSLSNNELNFNSYDLTNVNYITVEGLIRLNLETNKLREFNPIKKLPSTLEEINFFRNYLRFFTPDLKLPSNVDYLNFSENEFTTIGYAASEVWANLMYIAPVPGTIYFENNTNSVSGTNLESILIGKGWTVVA